MHTRRLSTGLTGRKRFWRRVEVVANGEQWEVQLDGRTLRTPSRRELLYPSRPLAAACALEWDAQGGSTGIQPTAMPVVAMCVTATDNIEDKNEQKIRQEVMKYLPTDSICFYDEADKFLLKRQKKAWRPLQKWVEKTYGHKLDVVDGIKATHHPEELVKLIEVRAKKNSRSGRRL
jgi:ATP synthase F1 complex assembly factor 2